MKIKCIFIFVSFVFCYDQRLYDPKLPIFEPFPTAIIDCNQLCSNGSTFNIALFNSNQRNMVALNLQLCGFAIYDVTLIGESIQLLKHFKYQNLKDQVISLSITNSDTFLWVGYSTGILEVYDISNLNFPLVYSTQITYQDNPDSLQQVIQFSDLNLTFQICLNNFKFINWQNNSLKILRTYDFPDWYIVKLRLALNQSVLIAQGFLSLSFYQQSIEDLKQGNLNLICTYTPSAAYDLCAFEVIQESILVIQIDLYQYIMIDIRQYIQSYDGKSCDPNKIVFLDSYQSNPQGGKFVLSKDQKFLYTQQSSIGILIFDVSQKKLEIFQIISTRGTSMNLELSKDGQHLFYSNWFNTQIFQVTTPNLNLEVPNLLLNQHQLTSYSFFKGDGGSFDNQIIYQEPQNTLYMTRKDQGSAVFEYQGEGIMSLISLLDYGLPYVSVAYQASIPGKTLFNQSRETLGLQIVDYKNISNPIFLRTNITLGFLNVKFEEIIFNKQGTLGFIVNIIQLIIIDIKDQLNPKVISTFETSTYLGGDQSFFKFLISNDEKTLLLFPELYGILFADKEDPKNPQYLFKLYLGQIYFLQQTIDNQYIICGVSFQGVFVYKFNPDHSLTFISSVLLQGVIYFQWLIYNDNYLITFQVGDQIEIYLVNIYQSRNLNINKALYYQNFVIKELPSWISFSPSSQVLTIQIAKESLIANRNGMYTQNPYILGITAQDSIKIKKICMNVGYLDKSGFVFPSYFPNNVFSFGIDYQSFQLLQKWNNTENQLQQVLNFIQFKLNQNIINYVIEFYTKPSLEVNFNNTQNPITSNQEQLIVTISISNGLFVSKIYTGILILINLEQNIIQLQGTVHSINSILHQKISVSFKQTTMLNSTVIQIVIEDFSNYKSITSLKLQDANFISFQASVQVKEILQNDFNNQYENGEIAVQTPFNQRMSDKIFECFDCPQLKFVAKVKIENCEYQDIQSGYWLSFSSNERTFFGTPSVSMINSKIIIQITATDGYTIAKQKVSKTIFEKLNNNKSRLFIMIKSLALEYYVECSPICKNIALMLKQKALETYKEIDWYKEYLIYESQQILDDQFPLYRLKQMTYQQAFEEILNDMPNSQKQNIDGINKNQDLQANKQNIQQKN
ncbi:hypothetical protein ABPG72_005071 [Tetrahymena utriculariae]